MMPARTRARQPDRSLEGFGMLAIVRNLLSAAEFVFYFDLFIGIPLSLIMLVVSRRRRLLRRYFSMIGR